MGVTITGTGSFIPTGIAKNERFENNTFFNEDGSLIGQKNEVIIKKFKAITGIAERRYIEDKLSTSDIASSAALKAIENSKIDIEALD